MIEPAVNRTEQVRPETLRVVFMGTPEFSVPSLLALVNGKFCVAGVVTQPDKPQGRHMIMTPPPVKTVALEYGIPVLQPEKIRTPEFLEQLKELQPDLIVTAAYGKILPEPVLSLPGYGCINVHASLLPLYRGAAPIQWCIINGALVSGVTIMKMDVGMDTGDIISQKEIEITEEMTSGELTEKLALLGASFLADTILAYCKNEIFAVPQEHEKATFVKPITREQGRIDWNQPVRSVHNLIRGCNPWPAAFTSHNDKRVKLYRAGIFKEFSSFSQEEHTGFIPGSIIKDISGWENAETGNNADKSDKNRLFVACSDGILEIFELQPEGSKRMNARECAHNYTAADVFK